MYIFWFNFNVRWCSYVANIRNFCSEITPVRSKKQGEKKESSESDSDEGPSGDDDEDDNDVSMANAESTADSKKRNRPSAASEVEQPRKKVQLGGKSPETKADGDTEIFCGGLPFGVSEEEIKKLFEDDCGKVVRVKLLGKGGAAFVEFADSNGAAAALEWNNTEYKGRKLNINKASDRQQRNGTGGGGYERDSSSEGGVTVCVKNIPFKAGEDEIKDAFKKFGKISYVRIPVHQDTGKIRG